MVSEIRLGCKTNCVLNCHTNSTVCLEDICEKWCYLAPEMHSSEVVVLVFKLSDYAHCSVQQLLDNTVQKDGKEPVAFSLLKHRAG